MQHLTSARSVRAGFPTPDKKVRTHFLFLGQGTKRKDNAIAVGKYAQDNMVVCATNSNRTNPSSSISVSSTLCNVFTNVGFQGNLTFM